MTDHADTIRRQYGETLRAVADAVDAIEQRETDLRAELRQAQAQHDLALTEYGKLQEDLRRVGEQRRLAIDALREARDFIDAWRWQTEERRELLDWLDAALEAVGEQPQ